MGKSSKKHTNIQKTKVSKMSSKYMKSLPKIKNTMATLHLSNLKTFVREISKKYFLILNLKKYFKYRNFYDTLLIVKL